MLIRALHHDPSALAVGMATTRALERRFRTLVRAWRGEGLGGVLVAAAGRLPDWLLRVEWYALQESRSGHSGSATPWPNARRAGIEDLAALVAVGHAPESELRQRLEAGDRAFVAFDDDGTTPIGYVWYRGGGWREEDIHYELDADERWGYDLFVNPAARGRQVSPRLCTYALDALAEDGSRRALMVIDHLNSASRSSAVRYAAVPVASVTVVAIPFVGVVRERAADGEATWAVFRRGAGLRRRPPAAPGAASS